MHQKTLQEPDHMIPKNTATKDATNDIGETVKRGNALVQSKNGNWKLKRTVKENNTRRLNPRPKAMG